MVFSFYIVVTYSNLSILVLESHQNNSQRSRGSFLLTYKENRPPQSPPPPPPPYFPCSVETLWQCGMCGYAPPPPCIPGLIELGHVPPPLLISDGKRHNNWQLGNNNKDTYWKLLNLSLCMWDEEKLAADWSALDKAAATLVVLLYLKSPWTWSSVSRTRSPSNLAKTHILYWCTEKDGAWHQRTFS